MLRASIVAGTQIQAQMRAQAIARRAAMPLLSRGLSCISASSSATLPAPAMRSSAQLQQRAVVLPGFRLRATTPLAMAMQRSVGHRELAVLRFARQELRAFSTPGPASETAPSAAPLSAASSPTATATASPVAPPASLARSPLSPAETAAAKRRIAAARRRRSKIRAQEEKLESALEKGGERQLISVVNLNRQLPKVPEHVVLFLKRTPQWTMRAIKYVARGMQLLLTDPAAVKAWWVHIKDVTKAELKHYWLGSKLLYADLTTSTRILARVAQGNALSRRERKQLQRTVADLLRLVPFAFFVIVPFMELLLPVALKLFPNMLPSTFKDSFQREEAMKRQLQMRVALAEFMQETVKDVMQDARDTEGMTEEHKATAGEVMDFIERSQRGQPVSSEETLRVATLFNDELMLDNISRPQLVAMCRYMGVQHFGNDSILRFQLRNRIRQLKKDDQDIIWEGLDSLDKEELQQACMERGMRATGLTKAGYMRQMRQWLDLSINKNVAVSLLIMSRALNITAMDNLEAALATSMSSLDEEVVTEVALSAPTSGKESTEIRELKLESIRYQNEMIADEEKFRAIAKKQAEEEEAAAAEASAAANAETLEAAPVEPVIIPMTESAPAEPLAADIPAPAAPTTAQVAPPKTIETVISLAELSALESLAFSSIVAKERQAVDQMKQNKTEMDVEGLLMAGRIGAQARENKATGLMMKKLDSMLSHLEKELDKVDQSVGDRLNILDRDRDGVVSNDELKDAVVTVLRKSCKVEDVEWVISQIDENKDGQISLDELVTWIAKCREVLEVTGRIPADEKADASASGKPTVKRASSRKN